MPFYNLSVVLFFINYLYLTGHSAIALSIAAIYSVMINPRNRKVMIIFLMISLIVLWIESYSLSGESLVPMEGVFKKVHSLSTTAIFKDFETGKKIVVFKALELPVEGVATIVKSPKKISEEDLGEVFTISNYYLSRKMDSSVYASDLQNVKVIKNNNFRDKVLLFLEERFSDMENKPLAISMLTGIKEVLGDSFKEALIISGAMHLIVVSGYHISILEVYFGRLGKYIDKRVSNGLFVVTVLFLVCLTNFHPSSTRVLIILLISMISSRMFRKTNKLNALGISAYLMMLYNPNIVLSLSFILTFLSTSVIYSGKRFAGLRIFFLNLPVIMQINSRISLLSLFSSSILMSLTEIIMPLSLVSIIFRPISFIADMFSGLFANIVRFTFQSKQFILFTYKLSGRTLLLLYLPLMIILGIKETHRKRILYIIPLALLIISITLERDSIKSSAHFIQAGNADSSVFIDEKRNAYVIDYGYKDQLARFLRNNNIMSVTGFRTHDHEDHTGGIQYLEEYGIKLEQRNENISNEDIFIEKIYRKNELNNSSDIYLVILDDVRYMVTGDALRAEMDNVSIVKADVLKVPHHGDYKHLDGVDLSSMGLAMTVIPTGTNSYGHPSGKTIELLEDLNLKYFRTDLHGTISIVRKKENLVIR